MVNISQNCIRKAMARTALAEKREEYAPLRTYSSSIHIVAAVVAAVSRM